MGHLKEQIYGEKKGKDIKENSYKEKNIKEIIEKLPDIPYRKALSIEANFASWQTIFLLTAILGIFGVISSFKSVEAFTKTLNHIQQLSPNYVKAEYASLVRCVHDHYDSFNLLASLLNFGAIFSVISWALSIFFRIKFVSRDLAGPKMLFGWLIILTFFSLLSALFTMTISAQDAMPLINLYQIRIEPVVYFFMLLSLIPFFSKYAEVYHKYVRKDKDIFTRDGAAWYFLSQEEISQRIQTLKIRKDRSFKVAMIAFGIAIVNILLIRALPANFGKIFISIIYLGSLWVIIESALLGYVLYKPVVITVIVGILTFGIIPFILILSWQNKAKKELELAPETYQENLEKIEQLE